MSIKLLLAATRPDQSADFWWDTNLEAALTSKSQTAELFGTLGITETTGYSEDGLVCTRTIISPTVDAWDAFMNIVLTFPQLLAARKEYFDAHGHSLSLTKVDLHTDSVFDVIPDAIAHLSVQ